MKERKIDSGKIHYTKKGQPYYIRPNGLARFVKRNQVLRAKNGSLYVKNSLGQTRFIKKTRSRR